MTYQELYEGAVHQIIVVLDVVDRIMPTRIAGVHPNLLLLKDVSDAMRRYLEVDREHIDAGDVTCA